MVTLHSPEEQEFYGCTFTVTFLFSDIEGSTALWERDRQAMAAAVARHLALLDAAILAHGGVHFKTIRDAVQTAFPAAPGPLPQPSMGNASFSSTIDARSAHRQDHAAFRVGTPVPEPSATLRGHRRIRDCLAVARPQGGQR